MSFSPSTVRVALPRVVLVAAIAVSLAGCASRGPSPSLGTGAEQPIATASDEGQARKRARLRLELAMGYFQQGQTTVALDEVKQALVIDPSYGEAYNLRGLVYMRLDDPGLAEDSFRRAISINPRDGNAMHNYGWLLCQQKRYADAVGQFQAALNAPGYTDQAKTLMTMGVCEMQAGRPAEAERDLARAYEMDSANPIVGYNLALLLAQRQEWARAQFYIRRVNNSQAATAESLWLGVKVERQLNNSEAVGQLGTQLVQRFPQSREALAYERGNFND
ncbi:type IV pilus biogenesis/stability protein PilW [Variovorax sp.]|uniref:type IV pilus biogenesis/stability protein PilW n=1 Tax=Variovorax sp. TaxID=1871043 RepID=UPI002D477D0C|nr:type IV pilus biogenesis/stability protein PilW [Variovorax sp.]HYP82582.1 type IV pilus biogenesis/stability protein PilW [Variovorax sp.]